MKVNYKLVLISVGIIVLLGVALFLLFYFRNLGTFSIEIQNNTPETIGDLKITYPKIAKDITFSGIPPYSSLKFVFKPQVKSRENAIWISYQDKSGAGHREAIFGYFEKNYHGKALVKIIKVEPSGVIKFEIKSDVKA